MSAISASSVKIADIVSVIDGIAFQTNILALNAAVEARARRAGQGLRGGRCRGPHLAQRSAGGQGDQGLIEDTVGKIGQGSDSAQRAGATMQDIVASVQRVTDIMGEIAAASAEQADGIEQVNRAVSQMDEVTQQNAALVEAAAAAGSMQDQAADLKRASAPSACRAAARWWMWRARRPRCRSRRLCGCLRPERQAPALVCLVPAGQRNTKRAPPSGLAQASMLPLWLAATRLTIASPRPAPPVPRSRLSSRRMKGSKMFSRSAAGMPGPSSSTMSGSRPRGSP